MDITTISDASETFTFTSDLTNFGGSQGLTFKHDGTKMYLIDAASSADGYLMEYNLSTAWDVSTASYVAKNSAGKFHGFGPGFLRGASFNDVFIFKNSFIILALYFPVFDKRGFWSLFSYLDNISL